jgi:hypothetical protein
MKKKKNNQLLKKYKKLLMPTFITVTIFCIVMLFASVIVLFQEHMRQEEVLGKNDIAFFISKAIEGLVQEAPTASYSNQQFIDSARVKFTKTESTSLLYQYGPPASYDPPDDQYNQSEFIILSSRVLLNSALNNLNATNNTTDTLNNVPKAQNCARLFAITFNDNRPEFYSDYTKINNKTLADGRTAYIWKTTGDLCIGAYESLGEDILNVIGTIESY